MKKENGVIYHYGYYRRAGRLRLAGYVVLLLLVVFVLVTFFAFREDLTADHFRYLLRNFELGPHSAASSGDTIYYDGDRDSRFGFVAGGFACLTDTRVFVTDGLSVTTLSDYHGFSSPYALSSEKYMLVYDRAGSSLSLYNAFDRLKSFTFEGTIVAAALSDKGSFAAAVSGKESYYSTVYVYDKNGALLNKLSKYKYVTSLALSPDGDQLAAASVYTGDRGILTSEILLLEVGKTEPSALHVVEGSGVCSLAFLADGGFAALFDDRVLFYDSKGKETGSVLFDATPTHACLLPAGALLVYPSSDTRYELADCYDQNGKALYQGVALGGRFRGAAGDDAAFYLLTDRKVFRLSADGEEALSVEADGEGKSLLTDNRVLYLAGPSSAVPVFFEKAQKEN